MRNSTPIPVLFVGTLPPPVDGMNVVTEHVIDALRQRTLVEVYNTSDARRTGFSWRLMKAVRSVAAVWRIIRGRGRNIRHLYIVANSGLGIWYNILHASIGRLAGYRVFLHHHVYAYVTKRNFRMRILTALMGESGTHILLCDDMKSRFQRVYPAAKDCRILPNTFLVPQEAESASRRATCVRIGHLSNLSLAKGIDVVLQVFSECRRLGWNVELKIAGPVSDSYVGKLIDDAQRVHEGRVEYVGPVYSEAKARFFEDIDVFLFPTRYRNEAYPLVIVEAMSHGVPVIAYRRACIPELLDDNVGLIDQGADFVGNAVSIIGRWRQDPIAYWRASEGVRARAMSLRGKAAVQLADLVSEICGVATDRMPDPRLQVGT